MTKNSVDDNHKQERTERVALEDSDLHVDWGNIASSLEPHLMADNNRKNLRDDCFRCVPASQSSRNCPSWNAISQSVSHYRTRESASGFVPNRFQPFFEACCCSCFCGCTYGRPVFSVRSEVEQLFARVHMRFLEECFPLAIACRAFFSRKDGRDIQTSLRVHVAQRCL